MGHPFEVLFLFFVLLLGILSVPGPSILASSNELLAAWSPDSDRL